MPLQEMQALLGSKAGRLFDGAMRMLYQHIVASTIIPDALMLL